MTIEKFSLKEEFSAFVKNHGNVYSESIRCLLLTVEQTLAGESITKAENKKVDKKKTHQALVNKILTM